MPTYEYECTKCGHLFERFQRITEKPKRTCPECKGRVKRLLGTGAGVIFKGSGFYQTDYRSQGYHEAAKKDKPQTKNDSGKKESKPDSKKPSSSSGAKSTKKD